MKIHPKEADKSFAENSEYLEKYLSMWRQLTDSSQYRQGSTSSTIEVKEGCNQSGQASSCER